VAGVLDRRQVLREGPRRRAVARRGRQPLQGLMGPLFISIPAGTD
jgi:hypothetical protein